MIKRPLRLISVERIMNKAKNTVFYKGKLILILMNMFSLYLIYGYANIASSTMPNNILGVNYESSGIQMLYYAFVAPIFATLSLVVFLIKKYITKEYKLVALIPLVTAFCFYIFLAYIDSYVHFPAGNDLFYQGSLVLALIFSLIALWCLFEEVKGLIRKRGQS